MVVKIFENLLRQKAQTQAPRVHWGFEITVLPLSSTFTALPLCAFVCLTAFLTLVDSIESAQPISRELPEGVEVVRDVTYATYGDRNLLLDLYLPTNRSRELLPTIVVIRGRGWRRGDKEGSGPMAAALAKRGLAAASIEYRASEEATFPAAVEDTKAAVRWLRANGTQHHVDPDAIGAIGGSAGAHLAVYLGVTHGTPQLEGRGGNQGASSAISAVVAFATPADFAVGAGDLGWINYLVMKLQRKESLVRTFLGSDEPELWIFASPITHVSKTSPPLLLMHGESDWQVPLVQSTRLAARYDAVGAKVNLVTIPDAPHAFWVYEEWFVDSMDRAAAFFWHHLGGVD